MSRYKKILLTEDHCKEVLGQDTLIGADDASDGKRKRFTYNALMNQYSVWHDGSIVSSSAPASHPKKLLDMYNDL